MRVQVEERVLDQSKRIADHAEVSIFRHTKSWNFAELCRPVDETPPEFITLSLLMTGGTPSAIVDVSRTAGKVPGNLSIGFSAWREKTPPRTLCKPSKAL